jgi:hypothetical protein
VARNGIFRVFPTQYFNILELPNNEDKYYYLQFNVTTKIEKIVESPDRQKEYLVMSPYLQSIEFTFLCHENYLNLPKNLLEIYLK